MNKLANFFIEFITYPIRLQNSLMDWGILLPKIPINFPSQTKLDHSVFVCCICTYCE